MRRAIALWAVACACLGVAGPAAANVRHAALGDVTADLTLTRTDGLAGNLHLSLTRAGTVVYSGPIETASGRPGQLVRTPPQRRFLDVRLRVLDLDGDGIGEAVIDLAEPGAYCCSHTVIVGMVEDGAYHPVELDWGSYASAAHYLALERGFAIVARDARLEERYTPHVLSFEPVRIWYWSHGSVQDVSRARPLLVQDDLSRLLTMRHELLHQSNHASLDLRGLFAAITGDRLLLGQRDLAARQLGADVAAHRVGKAFPPSLLRLLARLGY